MSALLSGRSGRLFLATLLASTLLPSAAYAFCRTTTTELPPSYNPVQGCFTDGLVLFWRNACVSYSVNEAASKAIAYDEAKRIIDASFETWTTSRCHSTNDGPGISITNLGPSQCGEVRYNKTSANQNLIVFRDDEWPYRDSNSTLGLTTVSFDPNTGEIRDADMEINSTHALSADGAPADGFDLASIVTHEAGHFFGLAHATNPASTMYANAKPGSISLRTLTDDDIDGICTIYPSAKVRSVSAAVDSSETIEATACDPTPAHGYTAECEGPATTSPESAKSGCATAAQPAAPVAISTTAALVAAALLVARRRKRLS